MTPENNIFDFHGFTSTEKSSGTRAPWTHYCKGRQAYNLLAIDVIADRGRDLDDTLSRDPTCRSGLEIIKNDMELTAYRDTRAAPAAYMAHACQEVIRTRGAAPALSALKEHLNTAMTTPVIEGAPIGACPSDTSNIEALQIHRDSPMKTTVDIANIRPGLVVLNDAYNESWAAYIDGIRAPIYRTNALVRGVLIPRSASTLLFVYQPKMGILMIIALIGALPALIISLMLALGGRRRSA